VDEDGEIYLYREDPRHLPNSRDGCWPGFAEHCREIGKVEMPFTDQDDWAMSIVNWRETLTRLNGEAT
jgi:hypothetical protein